MSSSDSLLTTTKSSSRIFGSDRHLLQTSDDILTSDEREGELAA